MEIMDQHQNIHKEKITESVPDILLSGDNETAQTYNRVQVQDILGYLFTNYAKFDQQYLINNRNRLTEELGPNRLFRNLTQRVQNSQEIATYENWPINNQYIVNMIYTVVFNTAFFYNDCDNWNNKIVTLKIWTKFQANFIKSHQKVRRLQKDTTKQGGFHGANTVLKDQLEQENNSLLNMSTTSSEDKDVTKIQFQKILKQITTTTNLIV